MRHMFLSKNVIYLRNKLGLYQQELADLVGCTQNAIHKIETGETRKPRTIVELANALRVEPDDLISKDLAKIDTEATTRRVTSELELNDYMPSEELKTFLAILFEKDQQGKLSKRLLKTLTLLANETD